MKDKQKAWVGLGRKKFWCFACGKVLGSSGRGAHMNRKDHFRILIYQELTSIYTFEYYLKNDVRKITKGLREARKEIRESE